jgi:hypothetical protein
MRKHNIPGRLAESFVKPAQESMVDTVRLGDETVCNEGTRVSIPHDVERQIQRQLLSHPELKFTSLCVHRTPNGVCLEGVRSSTSGH